MADAYIVEAVRTAGGRRNGRLARVHPADLGAVSLDALVSRSGVDPAAIDDVIIGCVTQFDQQANHFGRNCVLASRLPQSVPAVTIDRQCGSSQQAVQFAAQAVMSGTQDIVIAGGVESMSRVPMGSAVPSGGEGPFPDSIRNRFGVDGFSQFKGAEMVARKHGLTRDALDWFALTSHKRAAEATRAGAFREEIAFLEVTLADGSREAHIHDEGIRHTATLDAISSVKLLTENGVLSAASASQICDGSAALLVVSERALKDHGLTPMARIHTVTVSAGDPVVMLEEPLFATDKALKTAGLQIEDIGLYEVNEAFASIPLAWLKHTGADPEQLNVNGGAIALGHPLGASGAKLMTTLVHAMKARGVRYGLQTMCEGGGVANVTILEAV